MAKPTIDISWATNNDPLDVIQPPQILKNSGVVTNSVWGREYLNYQFYGLGVWVNWVRLDAMDRQRNLSDLANVVAARANLGLTATAIADLVQTTGTSTTAVMTQKAVTDSLNTKTDKTTQIIAGTGLTGGGTLAANRTLNVTYGNTAGTAVQGNDSRIVNAVPNSRTITAGVGLTGGGNLSANRTLSVSYGTAAGTAAQGNDSRIVNAVQTSRTITAGTGLTGGGDLSANRTLTVNYGTTAGTAAQGNDSRIVNAASNATVNTKEAALEAQKADKVITITAGAGLTGGGTLAANRTMSIADSHIPIGVGQTWQVVTRGRDTNHTNTTGRPIFVSINVASSNTTEAYLLVDGVKIESFLRSPSDTQGMPISMQAIVPAGAVYKANWHFLYTAYWVELR